MSITSPAVRDSYQILILPLSCLTFTLRAAFRSVFSLSPQSCLPLNPKVYPVLP